MRYDCHDWVPFLDYGVFFFFFFRYRVLGHALFFGGDEVGSFERGFPGWEGRESKQTVVCGCVCMTWEIVLMSFLLDGMWAVLFMAFGYGPWG